uniref:ATP synthase subunit 8 n=1 Tax=Trichomalopsis sarcophagae TaxID=543379 RepID=B5T2X9_9HYME|nr:ATP synthase F0 subunit 8 [Trichomalopsis sarcophagae]ACH85835.1 ATP synthase subunit 8 [Trichomalopsis sarcophagae]UVN15277.1 ATP synthase subunit 8 [Trichomalopsis sarcophagae]
MPQMSPMMWVSLYIYFILLLLFSMMMLYYLSFNIKINLNNLNNKIVLFFNKW